MVGHQSLRRLERGGDDDDHVELNSLVSAVRRNILFGLLVAGIVAISVLTLFLQQAPYFTSSAIIVLETRDREIVGRDGVLSDLDNRYDVIATELQVIKSLALARQVYEDLELDDHPMFQRREASPPSLKSRIRRLVMLVAPEREAPLASLTPEERAQREEDAKLNRLLRLVDASQRGSGYVIQITGRSGSARLATLVANGFATADVEGQATEQVAATTAANQKLAERLESLRQDVVAADAAVERYRRDNNLVDSQGNSIDEMTVSGLAGQLTQARADVARAQAQLRTAEQLAASDGAIEELSFVANSSLMASLRAQLISLQRDLTAAHERYRPSHPRVVRLESDMVELRSSIQAEVQRIIAAQRSDLAIAERRVDDLERRQREATRQIANANDSLVELRELERRASAAGSIYSSFLSRFTELEAKDGFETSQARIVSRAILPANPDGPKITLGAILGLSLGAAVGLGGIAVREAFSNGVVTPRQLREASDAPCICVLPTRPLGPIDFSPTRNRSTDRYHAGVRSLYLHIVEQQAAGHIVKPVVALCSPRSDKEAQGLALHLGRTIAASGDRVAVVNANTQQSWSGLKRALGNRATIEPIRCGERQYDLIVTADDRLSVVDLGDPSHRREHQLLSVDTIEHFVGTLRALNSIVVLSLPELLLSADARWFLRTVNIAYVTANWRETSMSAVSAAADVLDRADVRPSGSVLQQVPRHYVRPLIEGGQ